MYDMTGCCPTTQLVRRWHGSHQISALGEHFCSHVTFSPCASTSYSMTDSSDNGNGGKTATSFVIFPWTIEISLSVLGLLLSISIFTRSSLLLVDKFLWRSLFKWKLEKMGLGSVIMKWFFKCRITDYGTSRPGKLCQVWALQTLEQSCENYVGLLSKLPFPHTYGEKISRKEYIRAYLLCKRYFWFITIIHSFWVFSEDVLKFHCLEEKHHGIYVLVRTDHRNKVPVLWSTTSPKPGLAHNFKEINLKRLWSPLGEIMGNLLNCLGEHEALTFLDCSS